MAQQAILPQATEAASAVAPTAGPDPTGEMTDMVDALEHVDEYEESPAPGHDTRRADKWGPPLPKEAGKGVTAG